MKDDQLVGFLVGGLVGCMGTIIVGAIFKLSYPSPVGGWVVLGWVGGVGLFLWALHWLNKYDSLFYRDPSMGEEEEDRLGINYRDETK